MVVVFRDEQGTNLSADQVDGNFRHILGLYDDLLANLPTANGISNITVNGSQFTVWLEGGESFGPFEMPTAAFHWRGEWTNDTGYFVNDIVTNQENVWLILQSHVSPPFASFDETLESSGEPVFQLLWGAQQRNYPYVHSIANTVETWYMSPEMAGRYFRCLGELEVHLPWNTAFGWVVGHEIHFYQASLDPVTFVLEPGTTTILNPVDGYIPQIGGRGRVVTLKYVGANMFDIFGGLAIDPSL